jgi:hypothetical protein
MFENAKNHIVLIATGTGLSFFSIATIISFTEPSTAGLITILLLYGSIFLFVTGLCSIIGLATRQKYLTTLYSKNLNVSIRQGLLIGLLVTSSLALNAQGLMMWWVGLTLILFLIVIEVFFNLQ